jgi:hypothetical protein
MLAARRLFHGDQPPGVGSVSTFTVAPSRHDRDDDRHPRASGAAELDHFASSPTDGAEIVPVCAGTSMTGAEPEVPAKNLITARLLTFSHSFLHVDNRTNRTRDHQFLRGSASERIAA